MLQLENMLLSDEVVYEGAKIIIDKKNNEGLLFVHHPLMPIVEKRQIQIFKKIADNEIVCPESMDEKAWGNRLALMVHVSKWENISINDEEFEFNEENLNLVFLDPRYRILGELLERRITEIFSQKSWHVSAGESEEKKSDVKE